MEELTIYFHDLTDSEQRVFSYIYKHQEQVSKMKIHDLAEAALTSKTVIINLAQKLGFEGFLDFKYYLRKEKEKTRERISSEDYNDSLQDIIAKTAQLIDAETMRKCIRSMRKARTIYIIARGTSKAIGSHLEYLLLTVGIKCIFLKDYNLLGIVARMLEQDELLILISLSGETQKVLEAAQIAKTKGIKSISLTAFSNNSVAKLADLKLYCASNDYLTKTDDSISRIGLFFVVEMLINEIKNTA